VSGRARLPGGNPRKASQRHSRPGIHAPAAIVLPSQWQPGDRVRWREYSGTYLRDAGAEEAEIGAAGRVYRV